MTWNWQQPDWPSFRWDAHPIEPLEACLLKASGVMLGSVQHLDRADREQLETHLIGEEALKTSAIEGEDLDRDSIQSSIRRQLGLAGPEADERPVPPAERGVATMTVDLHRNWDVPLSHEMLFAWHRLLMLGRNDVREVGCYRTHGGPMQIVSGSAYEPTVHYEAPPSARVRSEMQCLLDWYHASAPDGRQPLPALTRAGIAHLHFVAIHPFEDGNGRIGRAVAEKCLAQTLGHPTLAALATTIERRRSDYYHQLAGTNSSLEITTWLRWFAEVVLDALEHSRHLVGFVIDKARLLQRLRGQLNGRQEKALLRLFREGPDAFRGGLSARNYISITGASRATATRDLNDLVAKGALTRSGQRKHARYQLNLTERDE